jgi:predicted ATPase
VQRIMQRNTRDVVDLSARLLALNEAHETFVGSREGVIFHGWAQLQGNRDPELFIRVQNAIEQLYERKHWVLLPFFITSIAEVMGDNGDVAAAVALLDHAAQLVEQTGERWCEPEIMRLKARFCAKEAGEASALLRASMARARQQGAKLWELRAACDLAEHVDGQGERNAGGELLASVYAWFTEGLNTPDLVRAHTLLAHLQADTCYQEAAHPLIVERSSAARSD